MIERLEYDMGAHPLKFMGLRMNYNHLRIIYTVLFIAVTTLISKGIFIKFL
jgi:hypothetical protein